MATGGIADYYLTPTLDQKQESQRSKLALALLQQGMDASPIKSWSQGAARIAQALMGGYMSGQQDRADQAREDEMNNAVFKLPGMSPQGSTDAPGGARYAAYSPPDSSVSRPRPAPPMGAGQGYATPQMEVSSPTEFNSMDAQVARGPELKAALQERLKATPGAVDKGVRTVIGEAGGEPPIGQQAVGNVILNRSFNNAVPLDRVVTAPNQFEPWNTPAGRNRMAAPSENSPEYENAARSLYMASQADPTNGATHFYSPGVQADLGRKPPAWDNGTGQTFGSQRFFQNDNPTQVAGGVPRPNTAPAQGPEIRAATLTPEQQAEITALWNNKATRPLAMQAYREYTKPKEQWRDLSPDERQAAGIPEGVPAQINSVTHEKKIGTPANSDIHEYEYAVRQGFKGSLTDFIARKRAGAGEFALQPTWGMVNGKPAIVQLGKEGVAKATELPPGFEPVKPNEKIDLGTHWGIVNPISGEMKLVAKKDLAGAAQQEKIGGAAGTAEASLPAAEIMAKQAFSDVDNLIAHKGLNGIVGRFNQYKPSVAMSDDERDAARRVDQIMGRTFLQGYDMLRGGGAITEVEGAQAKAAQNRFGRALSTEDAVAALQDWKQAVSAGLEKLRRQAALVPGGGAAPEASPTNGGWGIRQVK